MNAVERASPMKEDSMNAIPRESNQIMQNKPVLQIFSKENIRKNK